MADWQGDDYYHQSALQQAMANEQLAQLQLQGKERILDVGCGDGKITAQIAARVPGGSVLGVDPSPDMIAFASKHFGPPSHPNLRFEVGDARTLNYRGEFDLVVSFNALHWVPEQDAALRAIHATLKPEGQARLRMVPNGARQCIEDVIEDTRAQSRWAKYFSGFHAPYAHFTPEEYRVLAEQAGFRVRELGVIDKAWDFGTRDAFLAFSQATMVDWTQHVPASDRTAFITDVLDRYQTVATDNPREADTFKFYQMEVVLEPTMRAM